MRAPAFWQNRRPGPLGFLLSPAGAVYGAVTALRMKRGRAAAGVPVICIGNFVAGGAGKTPAAIAIAQMLIASGERPFFLSRGYGARRTNPRQPLRVDAQKHGAADVGDEPLLLARSAPAIICADRVAGAQAAIAAGASVIVMDDGLQSADLAHDLALAVVDGAAGVGNGLCIPAGPLRAPLAAQWRHVQALVVAGPGEAGQALKAQAAQNGIRTFGARLVPDPAIAARLRGARVLAFAGIGHPEKFFATLEALGASVIARQSFSDHHPYSRADLDALLLMAKKEDLLCVTTEKDFVRLPVEAAAGIIALPVALVFDDPAAIAAMVQAAVIERG